MNATPLLTLLLMCAVGFMSGLSAQVRVLHFGNRIDPKDTYATMERVDRILNQALDASGMFTVEGYAQTLEKASATVQPDANNMRNVTMDAMMSTARATYAVTGDLRRFGRLLVHDVLIQHKDSMTALIEGYGYAVADDSSMQQMDSAAAMATMRGLAAGMPSVKPYANRKGSPAVHAVKPVALITDPSPSDTSRAATMLRRALQALEASGKAVVITRDLLNVVTAKAEAGTINDGKLTPAQAAALNKQRIGTTLKASAVDKDGATIITFAWVVVTDDGMTYDVGTNTATVGKDADKAIKGLVTDALKTLSAR